MSDAYVPGVCNINRAEIASRRNVGYAGLAMFLVASASLLLLGAPWYVRVIVFVPAFIASIGLLQARQKFCVGYAAAGMQHADDADDTASQIADTKAVVADKKKARVMNMQSAMIALAATLLVTII